MKPSLRDFNGKKVRMRCAACGVLHEVNLAKTKTNVLKCKSCNQETAMHFQDLDVDVKLNRADLALIAMLLNKVYCNDALGSVDEADHDWAHRLMEKLFDANPVQEPLVRVADTGLMGFIKELGQALGVDSAQVISMDVDKDGNVSIDQKEVRFENTEPLTGDRLRRHLEEEL